MIAVLSLNVMYQFAGAQCPGGKVLMSIGATGCGCWGCTKMCVLPGEVSTYQSNGWRIGKCPSAQCCWFVRLDEDATKTETSLTGIYPNPVSGSSSIFFTLSETQKVSFKLFDMTGRWAVTLEEGIFEEGDNELVWNVSDTPAGIYFLRMEAGSYSEVKKVSVIK